MSSFCWLFSLFSHRLLRIRSQIANLKEYIKVKYNKMKKICKLLIQIFFYFFFVCFFKKGLLVTNFIIFIYIWKSEKYFIINKNISLIKLSLLPKKRILLHLRHLPKILMLPYFLSGSGSNSKFINLNISALILQPWYDLATLVWLYSPGMTLQP